MNLTRSMRAVVTAGALALALAACGEEAQSDGSGSSPTGNAETVNALEVTASEYGFDIAGEAEGGVVSLELANEGAEHHEFAFGRLEEGASIEDALKAMQQRKDHAGLEDLAGVPLLSPGREVTMIRELEPGTYAFLCFFPTADFTPHADKGMYATFEVKGDAGATVPEPEATIVATDKKIVVPELEAGSHTIEFRNDGSKAHEFTIFAATEPGATDKDFEKWMGRGQRGNAPLLFPGGLQSIEPGASITQIITLDEGVTYTIRDFEHNLEAELAVP